MAESRIGSTHPIAAKKKDPTTGIRIHDSGYGKPNWPLNRPLTTDYAYEDTRDPVKPRRRRK